MQNYQVSNGSTVICVGPSVAAHPEWRGFQKRVKPICIYLKALNYETIADRIRTRRQSEGVKDLRKDLPAWGSWDVGVDLEEVAGLNRFVEIQDRQRVILNIKTLIDQNIPYYRTADVTVDMTHITSSKSQKLVQDIVKVLTGKTKPYSFIRNAKY